MLFNSLNPLSIPRNVQYSEMAESSEIKDFFLPSLPSAVSEEDIRHQLRLFNIGVSRINIRERPDRTRFAFLTVSNLRDYKELQQVTLLCLGDKLLSTTCIEMY